MPGGIQPFHWYHLQVVSFGCSVAASVVDPNTGATTTVALKEDSGFMRSRRPHWAEVAGLWGNLEKCSRRSCIEP